MLKHTLPLNEDGTLNRQAFFDQAATQVIEQGRASYDVKEQSCLYRGPNGLKCAVGFFIEDNQDIPEGAPLEEMFPFLSEDDMMMLMNVQGAHDDSWNRPPGERFVSKFKGLMQNIAERYELDSGVLA